MISIRGMSKSFSTGSKTEVVFDNVTLDLPSDRRCAILGGEQSGKSVLVRMLAGIEEASAGTVTRHVNLSFPVGYVRAFRVLLSARENVQYAARIYGADPAEVIAFVDEVTGFGPQMDQPVRHMQLRDRVCLAYALSYAIPFDTYLIDEQIAPANAEFRELCQSMFAHRAKEAGVILATRNVRKALDYCDVGAVIKDRGLVYFADIKEAVKVYEADLAVQPKRPPRSYGGAVNAPSAEFN
jgi:capsular polysaccharide transport system ATP-binding protein